MLWLRLVVAFIVLFFALDRHQVLLFLQLWEQYFVIEDFEDLGAGALA